MRVEEQIHKLNTLVNEYYKCNVKVDGERMNELLQRISALLYYLETCRSQIHDLYQNEIFKKTDKNRDGGAVSVAKAAVEADVKYPAMYKLRRIMEAGYQVVGALRTNISYLKKEFETSKNDK